MGSLSFILSISLACLSVYNWHAELRPFLASVRRLSVKPSILTPFFMLGTIPKSFPFFLDIIITLFLLTHFGLSHGVHGAVVALAMSNTIAFFIRYHMKDFRRRDAKEV